MLDEKREKARKVASGRPVSIESPFSDYGLVVGGSSSASQTQTVITALVVVIVASLAVIVVDQFDQSLGSPSSSNLSVAQDDVLAGFADMTSLIGPLLLVLIAAVIIGVVQQLR